MTGANLSILHAVDRLYSVRGHRAFEDHAIKLAQVCFPSAIIAFHDVNFHETKYERHHCNDRRANKSVQAAWRRHALDSPVVRYYQLGGTDPIACTNDLVSSLSLKSSALYADCWKPFGVTHQIGMRIWDKSHVLGVSIKRDGRFHDKERALLRAIYPHFRRAWRNCSRTGKMGERCYADTPSAQVALLSPKELEVLRWIAEGKRNWEIAIILGRAPSTVKTQVENILRKLAVETRGAAAAAWFETYD